MNYVIQNTETGEYRDGNGWFGPRGADTLVMESAPAHGLARILRASGFPVDAVAVDAVAAAVSPIAGLAARYPEWMLHVEPTPAGEFVVVGRRGDQVDAITGALVRSPLGYGATEAEAVADASDFLAEP